MLQFTNFHIFAANKAFILWCISAKKVIYSAFGNMRNIKKNMKNIGTWLQQKTMIKHKRFKYDSYPYSSSQSIPAKQSVQSSARDYYIPKQ